MGSIVNFYPIATTMSSAMARVGAGMPSGWLPTYGEKSRQPFQVVISNGELAQIKEWVRKYPNIETREDLFGLWSTGNNAVVQLVFGPGENSRRTSVSYYQDTIRRPISLKQHACLDMLCMIITNQHQFSNSSLGKLDSYLGTTTAQPNDAY